MKDEKKWERVTQEFAPVCDENSKVYTTSVDEFDVCTIEFGNSLKGKVPISYPNGIIANYRIGGGEASNVGAGMICEIDSNIAYVDTTFNLEATVKGHDKENLDSIKENAPVTFRTRDRIVTLDDYSDLLRINFYDFLSLKTLRDEVDRKLVHIYYMMRDGYEMTANLVSEIATFISKRSMIGTTYDLNPFVPQTVDMDCIMYVDQNYDKEAILSNVYAYLDGVTFSYGEMKFEDTIVKSDLENEIKNTFDGILSFRINSPSEDIIRPTVKQNVLTKGNITITAKYL